MTNETKELLGILFNTIQTPSIGLELRKVAEDKLIEVIKGIDNQCKCNKPVEVESNG